jgi:hypothetical protein
MKQSRDRDRNNTAVKDTTSAAARLPLYPLEMTQRKKNLLVASLISYWEKSGLPSCYTVWLGNCFPTFGMNAPTSYSGLWICKLTDWLISLKIIGGRYSSSKYTKGNYSTTRRNSPEDPVPRQSLCGNLNRCFRIVKNIRVVPLIILSSWLIVFLLIHDWYPVKKIRDW